jgi:hypothetical protein
LLFQINPSLFSNLHMFSKQLIEKEKPLAEKNGGEELPGRIHLLAQPEPVTRSPSLAQPEPRSPPYPFTLFFLVIPYLRTGSERGQRPALPCSLSILATFLPMLGRTGAPAPINTTAAPLRTLTFPPRRRFSSPSRFPLPHHGSSSRSLNEATTRTLRRRTEQRNGTAPSTLTPSTRSWSRSSSETPPPSATSSSRRPPRAAAFFSLPVDSVLPRARKRHQPTRGELLLLFSPRPVSDSSLDAANR